jgi:hypothetical protein
MPEEAVNGLAPYAKEFMEDPTVAHLVVAVVSVQKTVKNHDKNEEHPVLRIRHWELVPTRDKAKVAKALGNALADRTGAAELPFVDGQEVPVKSADDPFPEDPAFAEGGNRELEGEDPEGGTE